MIFLRALIFSADTTTQAQTANMVKTYMATENEDLEALRKHVHTHGSPPHVQGIQQLVHITGSPGAARLSAIDNPTYFEQCMKNMFDMVIEVNSRMRVQDFDTDAAYMTYMATKSGDSYADASSNEERAWRQLCRVHGNTQPRTDFDRVQFMLTLCATYQGHNKTKRALLKALREKGILITNVPFSVAAPIIGAAAVFEDEIGAQMGATGTDKQNETKVMTVGTTGERERKMGATDVETCAICEKPGHNARDCLVFMQREGVCGHWFMHHIGKYRSGCTFGDSCRKKHQRPSSEPEENSKKQVASMATNAIPDTIKCGRFLNGGKPVLKEVTPSDTTGQKFNLIPNDTGYWMCNNKVWLQPEDDNDHTCTNCSEDHSIIRPCKDGAHHSGLIHQMALEMGASAVEEQRPFKWMSYGTQVQKDAVDANVNLATATRKNLPVFTRVRPATWEADTRFCYSVNAKTVDNACKYGNVKKCEDGA